MNRRASLPANGCKAAGKRIVGAGQQMVRHERGKLIEPEIRNLGEHLALTRDAVGHDDIKRRDAVAGDQQQPVAEVENLADLAAAQFLDAWQLEREDRFVIGISHAENMKFRV